MTKTYLAISIFLVYAIPVRSQTWSTPVVVDSNMNYNPSQNGVVFGNMGIGYVWGYPDYTNPGQPIWQLFITKDSGMTWSSITFLTSGVWGINNLVLADSASIFALAGYPENNLLFRSIDGGQTWSRIDDLTGSWFRYIGMFDRSNGIIDIDSSDVNASATFITYDGGNTLADVRAGGDYDEALAFTGAERIYGDWSDTLHWCYAANPNNGPEIVTTTNGGRNWTQVALDNSVLPQYGFAHIAFLRGTPWVWAIPNVSGTADVSSDYGLTWHPTDSLPSTNKFIPVTPSEAWTFLTTSLLHTTNSGASWQADSTTFQGYKIADLFFLNAHSGWALLYKQDSIIYVSRFTSPDSTARVNESLRNAVLTPVVYPNPAENIVHVHYPFHSGVRSAEVFDIVERRWNVMYDIIGTDISLNTEALPAGIYYLRITDNAGNISIARFTKQ
jgi:hypothetical protein